MIKKICLYGASGHGKVLKDIADSMNIEVVSFLDDNPMSSEINGVQVVKTDKLNAFTSYKLVISIGNNKVRKRISKEINSGFETLIHKTAIVSEVSTIQEGTVVMPSAVINANTSIGRHTIINSASVIEHDCIIADFVHISPNATITGGVSIGEGTHIGAGAVVIPGIKIGKWVTVGAGSVIIKDIPDFATVVGNPGKVIKVKE